MNGIAPYKKPMQNGFSIEGSIPEDQIVSAEIAENGMMTKRVVNEVLLEGVCLVPRQAYPSSIASAVYKSLGELQPSKKDRLRKSFDDVFSSINNRQNIGEEYWDSKWRLNEALDETIQRIMTINRNTKREELEIAFDSYKNYMIDLIMKSEIIFDKSTVLDVEDIPNDGMANNAEDIVKQKKIVLMTKIVKELQKLEKIRRQKNG
jgi:ABC-type antimicrobial peptide transport system permease subunit